MKMLKYLFFQEFSTDFKEDEDNSVESIDCEAQIKGLKQDLMKADAKNKKLRKELRNMEKLLASYLFSELKLFGHDT